MLHARLGRALAALCLCAAPSLAQEPTPVEGLSALSEAAEAQRAVPEGARDAAWQVEHERTLYHLGAALARHAPAEGGREYFLARAESVLEELVFAAGEGTDIALHAYAVLGDVHAARGEWEEAAAFYRAVASALLGEPGAEPRRLAPVPAPRLDERAATARVPEPAPAEAADVALDQRFTAADRALRTSEAPVALARVERELEAALREVPEGPVHLRGQLVLGDLRAKRDDWEQAARRYAEVVRTLVGEGEASPAAAADWRR